MTRSRSNLYARYTYTKACVDSPTITLQWYTQYACLLLAFLECFPVCVHTCCNNIMTPTHYTQLAPVHCTCIYAQSLVETCGLCWWKKPICVTVAWEKPPCPSDHSHFTGLNRGSNPGCCKNTCPKQSP